MSRIYTVTVDALTLSAVLDVFELTPADDKPITIRKVVLTPDSSETNQQLKVKLKRFSGAYTSGSGGGTPTPVALNSHDAAAGFTAESGNTTQATGGTSVLLQPESFPSQGGFEFLPDTPERPVIYQGEAFVVSVEESAGGAVYSGYAIVEEL